MEIVVAEILYVVATAYSGIRHNRRSAAGLVRSSAIPITATAGPRSTVETVVAAKLVTHLVCDIVNIEGITDG